MTDVLASHGPAGTLAPAPPAQEVPTPEAVRELTLQERIANTVASLANSVTAVYGISGSGKSSLADTAAEYNWEVHRSTSFCYALDPGGFGTKRLALIRLGIMQVWRPGNHVNFFETMELVSMGAIPETILDPETGYADPNVPLVLPRYFQYRMIGPCGHVSRTWDNEILLNTQGMMPAPCKECGTSVGMGNAQKVDRVLVRNPKCKNIGLRIYDSISAESDQGLILELPSMSAAGKVATNKEGGGALISADALTSGTITFGTGSKAQVGFMQNRAYGWLMNIGKIPDQKTPPICIFGVEQSKTDDETGGLVVLGPRIAGQARTGAVPGWVGNCVHAVLEPDVKGNMRHRVYLRTHVDPKDPRKIPYLAKHRGVPRGIPEYLEDPWDDDPGKRAEVAWSVCSLNYLFRLIDGQVKSEIDRLMAKYPDAPALKPLDAGGDDDVVEISHGGVQGPVIASTGATVSTPTIAGASVPAMPAAPAGPPGIAPPRRRGGAAPSVAPPPVAVAPVVVPPIPTVPPTVGVAESAGSAAAPSVPAAVTTTPSVPAPPVVPATVPAPAVTPSSAESLAPPVATTAAPPAGTSSTPGGQVVPAAVAGVQGTSPSTSVPSVSVGQIARRRPRPPVS
jgi:hypothetical protein